MVDRTDGLLGSGLGLMTSLTAATTQSGFVERPGCRLYYEVTGSGPPMIFAHGLGSNHLTWWQQVPYFAARYTCITFSHRGYAPSSAIPGGPDPRDAAGDLAALIEHLRLADVRLVAQSQGGWASIEYILAYPHQVRALVLVSTCGTIHKPSIPLADPQRLPAWQHQAAEARADMQRRGIAPPAGERLAREQPALHFLYRAIASVSAGVDREALRQRSTAMATRPPDVSATFACPRSSSPARRIRPIRPSSPTRSPPSCRTHGSSHCARPGIALFPTGHHLQSRGRPLPRVGRVAASTVRARWTSPEEIRKARHAP